MPNKPEQTPRSGQPSHQPAQRSAAAGKPNTRPAAAKPQAAAAKQKSPAVLPTVILAAALALVILAVILIAVRNSGTPADTGVGGTTAPTETLPKTEPPATEPPVTNPPATEPIEPPVPQDTVVHFAAAGDVLIHECVFRDAETENGYDFDKMFAGIAPLIKGADVAFVNMECPIAGDAFGARGYPDFNAPTTAGDALVRLGFNVVNIANNHMLDMDTETTGYKNSVAYWKTKNVLMIGGYESEEDYETIRTVTADGITIAFLSYTYGTGTVGSVNKGSPEMVVPKIKDSVIKRQVKAAKEVADLVFVSMHWGKDSAEEVTDEQVRLAKLLADCGADVIIGTHSHTVQPVEWLTGKGGNKTLCVYSLGNLISSQLYMKLVIEDILTFDIVKSAENGKLTIENVEAHPIVCHFETDETGPVDGLDFALRHSIRLYRLEDYPEGLCAVHGAHLAYGTYKKKPEAFTVASLWDYFRDAAGAEFVRG
ncbi:MAG: CapA family protein [Clostridia bacterium]|nr:CapA family protein [Clostridia bacterium]